MILQGAKSSSAGTAGLAAMLLMFVALQGCGDGRGRTSTSGTSGAAGAGGANAALAGEITIDGSSTVFPISKAAAEEFMGAHPSVKVNVARSGTGGGFKKFCEGKTDINDSSRPISESEIEKCRENGVEYIELKVAIDGLTVMVNPENTWCGCLTIAQLKALWEPGSKIQKWKDLDPNWPDEAIRLCGADADSGTFDYFTEVVVGKAKSSRSDYSANANDNMLVKGISGNKYALGYFGYSYYVENKNELKAIGIVPAGETSPAKCVKPTPEAIESGEYTPLSRPLFLHVNKKALRRPEVAAFLKFYLQEGQELVSAVGYIRLREDVLAGVSAELDQALQPAK